MGMEFRECYGLAEIPSALSASEKREKNPLQWSSQTNQCGRV